jgi:hypothetical protein
MKLLNNNPISKFNYNNNSYYLFIFGAITCNHDRLLIEKKSCLHLLLLILIISGLNQPFTEIIIQTNPVINIFR